MSYFKTEEFICPCCGEVHVSAFLIHLLNKTRELYGKPMIVTSGYRCKKHNKEVGGKPSSAHLRGMAADIACESSIDRFNLLHAALQAGFRRIGVGKDLIHLDVANDLPHPVIWVY